ncbi:MAG: hypothetical protein GEU74_15930 [Nitriliruptorales bacterium]|nr:hypothetical protein [Nitriliruptorales bacterium]
MPAVPLRAVDFLPAVPLRAVDFLPAVRAVDFLAELFFALDFLADVFLAPPEDFFADDFFAPPDAFLAVFLAPPDAFFAVDFAPDDAFLVAPPAERFDGVAFETTLVIDDTVDFATSATVSIAVSATPPTESTTPWSPEDLLLPLAMRPPLCAFQRDRRGVTVVHCRLCLCVLRLVR